MAKKIKQQYGIKYPFTSDGNSGSIVDVNSTLKGKVRSILMHIIFTPKGQKLRDPNFGSDLIKYIFDQNDEISRDNVKESVNNAIKPYLPDVNINNVEVLRSEEDIYEVYVKIGYSFKENNRVVSDNIIVTV